MRTFPPYSVVELSGSCGVKPALISISVASVASPWWAVVLTTFTFTSSTGDGYAPTLGHTRSPSSAYFTDAEKELPKGIGMTPMSTSVPTRAMTARLRPVIEKTAVWRRCLLIK